jgi:hypothetical protein
MAEDMLPVRPPPALGRATAPPAAGGIQPEVPDEPNALIRVVPLIVAGVLIAIGTVLVGKLILQSWNWSPYLYYPVPLVIGLVLPYFLFSLTVREWLVFISIGIPIGFLSHVLFSLLLVCGMYMPFIRIPSIWL